MDALHFGVSASAALGDPLWDVVTPQEETPAPPASLSLLPLGVEWRIARLERRVQQLADAQADLIARVGQLERPWWSRLWTWMQGLWRRG